MKRTSQKLRRRLALRHRAEATSADRAYFAAFTIPSGRRLSAVARIASSFDRGAHPSRRRALALVA